MGPEAVGLMATLLNVGSGVIVGAAVVFLWAVAWLYRTKFKDLKAMLLVAMAILMLPPGVRLVQEKTGLFTRASVNIKVENIQVAEVRPGEVMVYFTTSDKAMVFVEYTDRQSGKTKAYFPIFPIARTRAHGILVTDMGDQGGSVVLVINGARMLVDGRPVEIR